MNNVSQINLQSGRARAVIMPQRGGLISSLVLLDRHGVPRELLWLPDTFDANASSWPGGGLPLLFPFAGRVWHQGELYKYGLGADAYPMPLHGFSWAKAWDATSDAPDHATLTLRSNESTQQIYPFSFEMALSIKLGHTHARLNLDIKHLSPCDPKHQKMPVAIGWHPYFALGSAASLEIPAKTTHPVTAVGNAGPADSIKTTIGEGPWVLPNPSLASLILSDLVTTTSTLRPDPTYSLTITAGPAELMKHVVTWTNEPAKFHCVEPWMSLPDAVGTQSGCQWVAPGENLRLWLEIRCQ